MILAIYAVVSIYLGDKFMLQTGLLEQFSQVEIDSDPEIVDPGPSQEHVGLGPWG